MIQKNTQINLEFVLGVQELEDTAAEKCSGGNAPRTRAEVAAARAEIADIRAANLVTRRSRVGQSTPVVDVAVAPSGSTATAIAIA